MVSFFKKIVLGAVVVYLSSIAYDFLLDGADGIMGGWYIHRVFLRLSLLLLVLFLFAFLASRKNKILKLVGFNLIFFYVFLILLEFFSFAYLKINKSANKPSHILYYDNPQFPEINDVETLLWGDLVDSVGNWRVENKIAELTNCLDDSKIPFLTNNTGMRDTIRDSENPENIIFLGDSFIEGYMLEAEHRLSNQLEYATQKPHLNFGVAGANPLAYYLIYKHIAKINYQHNKIIVGIYTGNDFDVNRHPINAGFLNNPVYRAYMEDDTIKYTLAGISQSFSSANPEINFLRNTRDSLYNVQPLIRKLNLELRTGFHLPALIFEFSQKLAQKNYFDNYISFYEKPNWEINADSELIKSLQLLVKESDQKPILFVIIPDLKDIENYKLNKTNEFTPFIEEKFPNVSVVDLLPVFCSQENPGRYYIECDGHWNARGNKLAVDYLLTNEVYQSFLK